MTMDRNRWLVFKLKNILSQYFLGTLPLLVFDETCHLKVIVAPFS